MSWDSWGSSSSSGPPNPNRHSVFNDAPKQTVSSLKFVGKGSLVAVTCWDGVVGIYEYNSDLNTRLKAHKKQEAPVLDCIWDPSGENLLSAGGECSVRIWNLHKGTFNAMGKEHKNPIKSLSLHNDSGCLLTGSWDGSVGVWDMRTARMVKRLEMPQRRKVACMGSFKSVLAIGLGYQSSEDRDGPPMMWYDLRKIKNSDFQPVRTKTSNLKYGFTVCDVMPKTLGFAIASVEGRCHTEFIGRSYSDKTFSFKCHRTQISKSYGSRKDAVYSVNCVKFHPLFESFATGGSDGGISVWDPFNRSHLGSFKNMPAPITAMDIGSEGRLISYAIGYDWSRGREGYDSSKHKPNLYLARVSRDMFERK